MSWFHRRSDRKTQVSERELLEGGSAGQQQLRIKLDDLLDHVIALFPGSASIMAEVFLAIPGSGHLMTWRLRPDTSVALPIRVGMSDGLIGQVYQSGTPIAREVTVSGTVSADASAPTDNPHLLRTRSVLVAPITFKGKHIGILNLESSLPQTFHTNTIPVLLTSSDFKNLVDLVGDIVPKALSEQEIVADLIDKLRQQVAFAIDPGDLESTYYQILQISTRIMKKSSVSGGLILVRDDSLRLSPMLANTGVKRYWAVRAARIGAFNSEMEWDMRENPSIARRVIDERKTARVPDVTQDDDYKNSGTGFEKSSELIVPLLNKGQPIGVIGLVTPQLNGFDADDQTNLEAVAAITVDVIARSEEILAARRSAQQLALSQELLRDLQELYPDQVENITRVNIDAFVQKIYDKILNWARAHTGSEVAAIVLPEVTPGGPTYLTVHREIGDHIDALPPRWLSDEGITGRAYTTGTIAMDVDIQSDMASPGFVPYYKGVKSELAAPMKRGDETIGALDVESLRSHHYTSEHTNWVEFLAGQTAFVLIAVELARKTQLELNLETLSRDIEASNQKIRNTTKMERIRPERDRMLQRVLEEVRLITKSSVGRILIGMNAYTPEEQVDTQHGVLYYMVSTDPAEVAETAVRYFPITKGVSAQAFRTGKVFVFNDLKSRPQEYFTDGGPRDSLSGLFIPVYEGARIVGVLNFEADRQDAYPPEYVNLGQRASTMISELLVVTRLRLRRLLTDQLRDFETSILRIEQPDLDGYVRDVLVKTAKLADIRTGWSKLVLLRTTRNPEVLISSRTFSMSYVDDVISYDAGNDGDSSAVRYSVFRDAIIDRQPVLILDTLQMQTAEQRDLSPWPEARSMICVPMLQPVEGRTKQDRVIGFLAIASPRRSEFSEADKETLRPFAQSVVYGLHSLALLGARKDLIEQVAHNFSKALVPLLESMDKMKLPVREAQSASDLATVRRAANEVGAEMSELDSLVRLARDLLYWFLDLSNEELEPEQGTGEVINVETIVDDMEGPINTLARAVSDYTVVWERPATPLFVEGGPNRRKLIDAALFNYVENAIKYSQRDDIRVRIYDGADVNRPGAVVFAVSSSGDPIDPLDRELLFDLKFRSKSSKPNVMGSGVGLFQVREIADRLGGRVDYQPTPDNTRNVFYLYLPAVDGLSR